jgi:hypothetical protein
MAYVPQTDVAKAAARQYAYEQSIKNSPTSNGYTTQKVTVKANAPETFSSTLPTSGRIQTTYNSSTGQRGLTNYDTGESFDNPTATVAPDTLNFDILARQKELTEQMRKSRIAKLDSAKTNALTNLDTGLNSSMSNLDTEQAGVAPVYYDKRNQAASASDVGAMNFAQYMAARGIKGNAGAMPEIYRNNALQGEVGALNRQESAINADIGRRRTETQNNYNTNKTGIQNAYESDVANADAEVEAQSLQNYITQMNADRAYNQSQQQYKDTQADKSKQDYANTLGQFSNNYQAEIDKVTNDNDPNNDWQLAYLNAARNKKVTDTEATTQAIAAAKIKAENEQKQQEWNNALAIWKQSGAANESVSAVLGVPVGTQTADYDLESMRIENAATTAANSAAATADNAAKKDYGDYIESTFFTREQVGVDALGNPKYSTQQTITPESKAQLTAYLQSLLDNGASKAVVDYLAAKYGV